LQADADSTSALFEGYIREVLLILKDIGGARIARHDFDSEIYVNEKARLLRDMLGQAIRLTNAFHQRHETYFTGLMNADPRSAAITKAKFLERLLLALKRLQWGFIPSVTDDDEKLPIYCGDLGYALVVYVDLTVRIGLLTESSHFLDERPMTIITDPAYDALRPHYALWKILDGKPEGSFNVELIVQTSMPQFYLSPELRVHSES